MRDNPENLKMVEKAEPIYPIGDKGFVKRSDVIKMFRDKNVISTIDYSEQNGALYTLTFTDTNIAMAAMKEVWEMYLENGNG